MNKIDKSLSKKKSFLRNLSIGDVFYCVCRADYEEDDYFRPGWLKKFSVKEIVKRGIHVDSNEFFFFKKEYNIDFTFFSNLLDAQKHFLENLKLERKRVLEEIQYRLDYYDEEIKKQEEDMKVNELL